MGSIAVPLIDREASKEDNFQSSDGVLAVTGTLIVLHIAVQICQVDEKVKFLVDFITLVIS